MSTRRFLTTNLATNAVLGVLGVLSSSLAGWTLGAEGRGRLAALQVTPAMIGLLAGGGLPESVVYHLSGMRDRAGAVLGTATRLTVATSLFVTALAVWPAMFILGRYDHNTRVVGMVLVVAAPVVAMTNVWHQALRGLQHVLAWNAVRVVGASIWLVAIVVGAVAGRRSHIAGLAYAALLVPMLAATVALGRRSLRTRLSVDASLQRPLIRFALPSVAASIPLFLNLRLDQVVLTRVASTRDLGLYAAATGFTWAVNPPLQAIASVAFPTVAAISDPAAQQRQVLMITRLAIPVCAITAGGVAAVTPLMLPLLNGPGFRDAVPVALILVVAGTIFAYEFILEEAARGIGMPRIAFIGQFAGLGTTLVALALLIPLYGIVGAALASVAGYATASLVELLMFRRRLQVNLRSLLVTRRADLAAVRGAFTSRRRAAPGSTEPTASYDDEGAQ